MTENRPASPWKSQRAAMPFYLIVLIAGLLWLALTNGLRLAGAVRGWEWLNTLAIQPGPLYIALTGGIFAAGFLLASAGLLTRRAWSRPVTLAVVGLYAAWLWIDRLLVAQSWSDSGWPFALGATLVLVVFTFAALSAARAVFGE